MENQVGFDYLNQKAYLSESEAIVANSSGLSIQYSFLAIFSLVLVFKIILGCSSSLLWNLTHLLQIFRVIILINIYFPSLIIQFSIYLKIASGDIEELNDLVPDVLLDYILVKEDLNV